MTKVCLKWLDNDIKHVCLVYEKDGKSLEIVYPPREIDIDDCSYVIRATDVFDGLRTSLQTVFGPRFENNDLLANLICADRVKWAQYNIYVDDIPVKVQHRLRETVLKMAMEWNLSDHRNIEEQAGLFAQYVVDNRRWLFDYEVVGEPKSLLKINKDALELEWYEFNHDENKCQEKFSKLVDDEKGVGSYLANRWMTNIKANLQIWESSVGKHTMKGE